MEEIVQFLIAEYGVSKKDIRKCLRQTAKKYKKTQKEIGNILLSLRVGHFDTLPDEMLLMIMEGMDYRTLTLFCSVSRRMKEVCKDENFWKGKLARDFQAEKIPGKTWKETYRLYHHFCIEAC